MRLRFFIFLLIPNIWITTAFLQRDAEGRNVKFQLDVSFTFHDKSRQPTLENAGGSFTILERFPGKKKKISHLMLCVCLAACAFNVNDTPASL